MADFKDHFSRQSSEYGKFRPQYPAALYHYLAELCAARTLAWDCASGTGQAARGLAGLFDQVVATDASAAQIENATGPENIIFRVAAAEQSGLERESVDLVTVAQALHWFDLDLFYREVRRTMKPGGILAVWSYNQLRVNNDIDAILDELNADIVGPYWPAERQMVRDGYRTIDFPFEEIYPPEAGPAFRMTASWRLEELMGYLATWSSVVRYQAATGRNPLAGIYPALAAAWGNEGETRRIHWPLTIRAGRL